MNRPSHIESSRVCAVQRQSIGIQRLRPPAFANCCSGNVSLSAIQATSRYEAAEVRDELRELVSGRVGIADGTAPALLFVAEYSVWDVSADAVVGRRCIGDMDLATRAGFGSQSEIGIESAVGPLKMTKPPPRIWHGAGVSTRTDLGGADSDRLALLGLNADFARL